MTPGFGFPIARVLVIFSLSIGTVLDAVICPHLMKQRLHGRLEAA